MAERKSYKELDSMLEESLKVLGLTSGHAGGRVFVHIKSGDHYVAVNAGIKVGNLDVEVEYHPLTHPSIRFHREIADFMDKFQPVQYRPD